MTSDATILVVNHGDSAARNLKELLEFMDTPRVQVANPDNWRESLGERRLQAVFIGPDLVDAEIDTLLAAVGEMDPNVSIVLLNEAATE